ncbi:hypothetical protein AWC38_SpisGene7670 [Stylophora pistillata]|uniref:Uncharacterized protein n=1 Tax=Stylophora pistillata TaxID=50429 RepID=A0A2B4SE08_STYPI|nr:hypothetical protein AWC38_SpisGene7670 [Stylophora pistillata]
MAALHMAAAAACRGSTSTGGHCCCDNKVMVRNTADLKTCATISAASSYPNCDGEVSIYGRERKATQNGEMVGSFYNYKCGHGAKGGSEASYPDKAAHGTATDELEDVHIDRSDDQQSIDENLPLASALLPRKSSNENLTLENLPSPDENLAPENLPSSDENLAPENLPSTDENLTPENLPSTGDPPPTDENLTFDQSTDSLPASSKLSPTPLISSNSPILDPQDLITSTKPAKPPSRRTAARLAESSLTCSSKPTTPTLVTRKSRSAIPVPTSTPISSLDTHENDMETAHDLKRKSSDLSRSRKETPTPGKKKGKKYKLKEIKNWWEFLKRSVKEEAISFSRKKRRRLHRDEVFLTTKFIRLR